jgi:hypothetical protein
VDDPDRAPVIAVWEVGREQDLVPLRRPVAVADVEPDPVRRDLPQAAAVEPDCEEGVGRVVQRSKTMRFPYGE